MTLPGSSCAMKRVRCLQPLAIQRMLHQALDLHHYGLGHFAPSTTVPSRRLVRCASLTSRARRGFAAALLIDQREHTRQFAPRIAYNSPGFELVGPQFQAAT